MVRGRILGFLGCLVVAVLAGDAPASSSLKDSRVREFALRLREVSETYGSTVGVCFAPLEVIPTDSLPHSVVARYYERAPGVLVNVDWLTAEDERWPMLLQQASHEFTHHVFRHHRGLASHGDGFHAVLDQVRASL